MNQNSECGVLPKVYTISRCTFDNRLYGKVHWSSDGVWTFCGADTAIGSWWILTNNCDGQATCKKCINVRKKGVSG